MGDLAVEAGPAGVRRVRWREADGGGNRGSVAAVVRSGAEDAARAGDPADRAAAEAARQLAGYLRGERRSFDLPLSLPGGPPFTRRVLEELARIPYGETVSYGRLAERSGRPKAARAVGNAVARNPLPLVLPCHRVIRSDGSPGEYGGGKERKRALLRLEGWPGE